VVGRIPFFCLEQHERELELQGGEDS